MLQVLSFRNICVDQRLRIGHSLSGANHTVFGMMNFMSISGLIIHLIFPSHNLISLIRRRFSDTSIVQTGPTLVRDLRHITTGSCWPSRGSWRGSPPPGGPPQTARAQFPPSGGGPPAPR